MYDNNTDNCKNKQDSFLGDLIGLAMEILFLYLIGLVMIFIIKALWKFLIVPISKSFWYILTLLWEEAIIPLSKDLWYGFTFSTTWLTKLSRVVDQQVDRQLS